MTTKQAAKIVNGMKQGLSGNDLAAAIAAATTLAGIKDASDPNFEKVAAQIRNEYVQHAWDEEDDLTGPRAAKPAATKKTAASKKVAKKIAAPKKVAKKTAAPKKTGVGARQRELILAGKDNDGVLAQIKKEFPKAETTSNCVAWYRSKMRSGKFGKEAAAKMKQIDKAAN